MVYAANSGSNTVSVIDGKTDEVVKNIPVQITQSRAAGLVNNAVAVNPNTNMIYVANSYSNAVFVIDGKTENVVKTLQAGGFPIALSVNSKT